jgi:hypothetical protein
MVQNISAHLETVLNPWLHPDDASTRLRGPRVLDARPPTEAIIHRHAHAEAANGRQVGRRPPEQLHRVHTVADRDQFAGQKGQLLRVRPVAPGSV